MQNKPNCLGPCKKEYPLQALSSQTNKSNKCPVGSTHRVWEVPDETFLAATAVSRFNPMVNIKVGHQRQHVSVPPSETTFVLYDEKDDKHINTIHNIVRRDIWEGFVVDSSQATAQGTQYAASKTTTNPLRVAGRLARYNGTIGFRCRFCKNAPLCQRAERAAVYPRSLERIYLANTRFQRDHIE